VKRNYHSFWLTAIIIFSLSCAVREAPKGGPADTTPPTIMTVEPSDGSVMLPVNATFSITFSKNMRQENTEAAIFLSPVFWDFPNFKWSGRKLTVIPPENLKANTTYILTIGAGALDIHNNKFGRSQNYAFSTGAAIDSGLIAGAIFSADGQRTVTVYDIWAYSLGDTAVTNFWFRIPDYATQVDSTGGFRIEHLGAGRYLVLAINDKNDDLFWDPSAEELGLPPGIFTLKGDDQLKGAIFTPARRDTASAIIARITPLSSQRLAIEFSQQPTKELEFKSESYRIESGDSLLRVGTPYLGEGGALILETSPQVANQSYLLMPVGLRTIWGVPFDTAGTRFTGVAVPDTESPRLLSSLPPNGSSSVYEDSVFEMTFTKRMQVLTFQTAVTALADSSDTLRFIPNWIAPNQVRLRFPTGLPREKNIRIVLNPKKITDTSQNPLPESSLIISFRLPPKDTIGTVTASLESGQSGNIIGVLSQYVKGGAAYQANFNQEGRLIMTSVMPGSYRFEFFDDTDSNGEWSPGMVVPFKPAEQFSYLPDTIVVRSRWSTEIGSVSLPNLGR
jgi:hypothetical protein